MFPRWRLTRSPQAHALTDYLAARGIVASQLDAWVFDGEPAARPAPDGITLTEHHHAELDHDLAGRPDLEADDRVVLARSGRHVAGSVVVSARPVFVRALDRFVYPEEGYVQALFVEPPYRERGIGSALVNRAVAVSRETFDRDRELALIGPDNRPSQWTFGAVGFERRERHAHYRVGPFTRDSVSDRF